MKIEKVSLCTRNEWKSYWQSCQEATFFHSVDWFEIWAKHLNGKLYFEASLFTFSDGKTVLLPYAYTQKLGVQFHLLSLRNNYGGWIAVKALSQKQHDLIYKYILQKMSNLQWVTSLELYTSLKVIHRKYTTSLLEYHHNFEQTFLSFKRGPKYSYRKAQKEGCQLSLALALSEWKSFYEIYLETVNRWDKATYVISWEELQLFYEQQSEYIRLYVVYWENKMICGGLFFCGTASIHYWQGASLSEFHDKRGMHFMLCEVIRQSISEGFKSMDMGTSESLKGVLEFKQGFNTIEVPYGLYIQNDLKGKLIKIGAEWKKKIL